MSTSIKIQVLTFCYIFQIGFIEGKVTGCTGQILGEQNPDPSSATAGGNSDTSYALLGTSVAIPCCGVVSEFNFATAATGDLTVQVWKNTSGNTYEVAGEASISVTTAGTTMTLTPSSSISVAPGYIVGWHSSAGDIIPFETDGGVSMGIASNGGKTGLGASQTWSGGTDGQRWHFGVTVGANSAPYFTGLPSSVNITTTSAVDDTIFTVSPTDDNPDDIAELVVSLSPASASEFKLDGNDIQVASGLATGTYEVITQVSDGCNTATSTLTVYVTDIGPDIISLPVAAAYELREDTEEITFLHQLEYDDLDTNSTDITCSLSSTVPSPAPFDLLYIPGTLDLGVYFIPDSSNHLDYDQNATYYLYVVCNDGTTDSSIELFQVDIVPNEPPVPDIPASIDVTALTGSGEIVHYVTATDASIHPDGRPDTLNFTMDNCSCPFEMLPNGAIYTTEDLNAHRTSPYVVNITVTDSYKGYDYNKVGPTQMTIHITDINTPPNITYPTATAPGIQTITVKEHTDAEDLGENLVGTVIDTFVADGFDVDGDTITWDIEFYNGNGETLFNYDSTTGEITSAQDLDYEYLLNEGLLTTTAYIRAFDGREYSETRQLNIEVVDENEIPVFAQDIYSIETTEGTDTTETLDCPMFEVIEEDYYDTTDYVIDCDTIGYIQIPSTRTRLCETIIQKTQEHDLDNPGRASEDIVCLVTVTDKGGLTATATVVVTVKEIDDIFPVLDQGSYTYSMYNDSGPGYTFGSFFADDDDFLPEHRRITYTTDSSEFKADPNGVFVNTKDWTTVNAPTSRTFTLFATDEAGHQDSAEVTVYIDYIPTTTTTTTPPTTIPPTYDPINSFLDDIGNIIWMILAILLGLLLLGLLGFMCLRCCMTPGACMNSCRGGRCFGRGGGRGRGFFGRRTFFSRFRQPKRVVKQPKSVRVVEKQRPVRVVEKRPVRVVEEPRHVRVVEEPRRVRVVEEPRHVRVVEKPEPTEYKPPVQEKAPEPVKPIREETPKEKSSFFDIFKKKAKSPEPKAVDEPKGFHLWGTSDYQSQQKWVG